jgi:2-polyprenyl-3-methyl-5-hydroxy-6-metoxy-1,4-benzoquinol methylase
MLTIIPICKVHGSTMNKNSISNRNVFTNKNYSSDIFVSSNTVSFKGKNPNEETVSWYDENAQKYFAETKDFSMQKKYPQFLSHVPDGGEILDAGCGSGRDAKAFSQLGYKVTAFDASSELAKLASENTGLQVIHTTFEKFKSVKRFDGIWACASLLHVPKENFEGAFTNLTNHLNANGVLCASMKLGETEEKDSKGRFFNYVTPEELKKIFSKHKNIKLLEMTQAENTFRVGDHPFISFVIKRIKL